MAIPGNEHSADKKPFAQAAWVVLSTALLFSSGCAAPAPKTELQPVGRSEISADFRGRWSRDERRDAAPADGEGGVGAFPRGANTTAGFIGVMLKTYSTDPVVRPVSTAMSLGFLVKNSASDFANRLYLNSVALPAATNVPVPSLADHPGMDLAQWERELDKITGSKRSNGTLEFLIDGEEFFSELVKEIEGAERSIQLRTYIFDNDDYAVGIADLLKRRSQQVDVTVLMDGIGTVSGAHFTPASMPALHNPPGSIARYLRNGSKVKARVLTNPWFTGDHCKVAIIDRKVAFLGGMNIGREYRFDWHDLMVKVEGDVVEELARDADSAWARSGMMGDWARLLQTTAKGKAPASNNGYPIRILYTRAHHSQIYQAKLAAIRRAKSYIYMENPYFSDDAILFELIRARRRGVDVRFVISQRGDMPLMDMSNVHAINTMLSNGIRVFLYPGMAHAKAAIIDGWLTVGSANLDHLSMRVNTEMNIATSHPGAVEALKERLFEPDFHDSVELKQHLPIQLSHRFAEALADIFM